MGLCGCLTRVFQAIFIHLFSSLPFPTFPHPILPPHNTFETMGDAPRENRPNEAQLSPAEKARKKTDAIILSFIHGLIGQQTGQPSCMLSLTKLQKALLASGTLTPNVNQHMNETLVQFQNLFYTLNASSNAVGHVLEELATTIAGRQAAAADPGQQVVSYCRVKSSAFYLSKSSRTGSVPTTTRLWSRYVIIVLPARDC